MISIRDLYLIVLTEFGQCACLQLPNPFGGHIHLSGNVCSGPAGAGAALDLSALLDASAPEAHQLFSEYGGVVVEIPGAGWEEAAKIVQRHGVPMLELGRTSGDGELEVRIPSGIITLSKEDLAELSRGNVEEILYG